MNLIIGILGRPKMIDRESFVFSKAVSDVIIKYSSLPLGIIPPNLDVNLNLNKEEICNFYRLLDLCDGFILQGGDDTYDYDKIAINYLNKKDIPLLGICLGMQSLALASGGKLKEKALTNHFDNTKDYVHDVYINKESFFYKIIKKKKIKVNSRHFDMVTDAGEYNVSGLADDNVICALEHPLKQFSIGVQWHPESLVEFDKYAKKLFFSFFRACQRNKQINKKQII